LKQLRNAGFALFGSIAGMPFQIFGGVLVARSLGPELFGHYSFAVTFSYFFACFAEGGLGILATRELARHRDEPGPYLASFIFLKFFLSVVFFSLMLLAAWFWQIKEEQWWVLLIVGLGNFLSSLCILLVGIARAYERMKVEGLVNFSQAFFFVVLLFVLIVWGGRGDVEAVATCFMVSYLLTVLLGMILLGRYFRQIGALDFYLTRTLSNEALTISIGWIVLLIYTRVGIIALEAKSSPEEVGYFNAALRLALCIGIIPNILAGAFMPLLARSVTLDRQSYARGAFLLMKYLLIGGVLVTIPFGLTSDGLIELIYGEEFMAAAPSFALLMVAMFFFFVSFGPKTFLESSGRQGAWGVATCAGLIVNVLVTLWLAPTLGATGASLGLLSANLLIALLSVRFCVGCVEWSGMVAGMVRVVFGIILMVLISLPLMDFSWFLALVTASGTFLVYLLIIKELRLNEIKKLILGHPSEG